MYIYIFLIWRMRCMCVCIAGICIGGHANDPEIYTYTASTLICMHWVVTCFQAKLQCLPALVRNKDVVQLCMRHRHSCSVNIRRIRCMCLHRKTKTIRNVCVYWCIHVSNDARVCIVHIYIYADICVHMLGFMFLYIYYISDQSKERRKLL